MGDASTSAAAAELTTRSTATAGMDSEAGASPSEERRPSVVKPVVTIISTRSGRRTSIHHDTDFADRMNAYIVSPLIPLPKPSQHQPFPQQRQKQGRAARRSVSCPEPASTQQQPKLQHPAPHQHQLNQRRKPSRRNPTLERLLQPCVREMSRSEQLLDKMRSLKLRIQRHAVQTNCGNVSVADWPPPDVLLAHSPPQRSTSTSPSTSASGTDGGGIVCTDSDIKSIIASIQEFEKSVQQSQLAQLIEVISLPSEPPLPPCISTSPNRQGRQLVRKQVCFIDPKQNRLVMPHHLVMASAATATASPGGRAPDDPSRDSPPSPPPTPSQRRSSPPPPTRRTPSPPPPLPAPSSPSAHLHARRGSLCDSCHHRTCAPASLAGPSGVAPPDVQFDENGQTWDVYGADLDPDLLGKAIQSHLTARRQCGSPPGLRLDGPVPIGGGDGGVDSGPKQPPATSAAAASAAVAFLCCAGGRERRDEEGRLRRVLQSSK